MLRITKAIYLEINQNCITCRKIIEYLIGLIEMMTYYFSSCLSYFLFIFYRTEIKVLKHILLTGFNCSFLWILHFTLFVPPPPPPLLKLSKWACSALGGWARSILVRDGCHRAPEGQNATSNRSFSWMRNLDVRFEGPRFCSQTLVSEKTNLLNWCCCLKIVLWEMHFCNAQQWTKPNINMKKTHKCVPDVVKISALTFHVVTLACTNK